MGSAPWKSTTLRRLWDGQRRQPGQRPGSEKALKNSQEKGGMHFMTITESAVVQRIRRKLRHTDYRLRKARGERQQVEVGRYYVTDTNRNTDHLLHVNIEAHDINSSLLLGKWRFSD